MPYEFTADDFTKFTDDILKAEGDQATLTAAIIDMQGTITEAIAQNTQATEQLAKLSEENQRLRERNLELFYQVGNEQRRRAGIPAQELDEQIPEEKSKGTAEYMLDYFNKLEER